MLPLKTIRNCLKMRAKSMPALMFVFLHLVSTGDGFLLGAPYSTCWTRYPKHNGLGTQTTPCPFLVTFSSQTYTPGEEIKVTIQAPSGRNFSGIQMAAFRDCGNKEEIVGQFISYPEEKLKSMTCFGGFRNMITHKNDIKVEKMEITWKAPSENVGNLTFKGTVVENFETFWTGVEVNLLSATEDPALIVPPQYQAIGSKPVVRDLDFSGCGSTKGCFLYPRHCSNSNCLAAVSFQHRPHTDDYLFEMYTTAENYISLGFSEDIMMGHDETVTCVGNSGQVSVQHGWNPHYHNERLLTRFLSESEIKHSDGRLQCRFVLPGQTSVYIIDQESTKLNYTNITYDRNHTFYLMLAWGRAMPASDVITIHKEMPAVTDRKVSMKQTNIQRGSGFHVLVQVHVAVMMVAWIFLGGIVTVVSRHYRQWMPNTTLFGTKVWFQVHRELAILMVILTVIGIIVIFSHYGSEIRSYSVPHAYVGLTVVAALGAQVIMGFIRPGPNHKMRFIFNWAHRLLGQATHILAAATMFLAYEIDYITKDMRTFGMAVLSVWVVVQLIWHFVFESLSCKGMPLSSSKVKFVPSEENKVDNKCGTHTVVLAIYVIFLAGICTACLLAFLLF